MSLKLNLMKKIRGFKARFKENRSSKFRIMYYSAGYYDEKTQTQYEPYNLGKLLTLITRSTPSKKRYLFRGKINEKIDPSEETKKSWLDSLIETISDGIDFVGDVMDKVGDVAQKNADCFAYGRKIVEHRKGNFR